MQVINQCYHFGDNAVTRNQLSIFQKIYKVIFCMNPSQKQLFFIWINTPSWVFFFIGKLCTQCVLNPQPHPHLVLARGGGASWAKAHWPHHIYLRSATYNCSRLFSLMHKKTAGSGSVHSKLGWKRCRTSLPYNKQLKHHRNGNK